MNGKVGKPIVGAILGGFAALVVILILMVGAILPPSQFLVWVLIGLGMLLGATLLTVVFKATKYIVIVVLSVIAIGWGAAGYSTLNGQGFLDGGCTLNGESYAADGALLDAATPDDTSGLEPFQIEPNGEIDWSGTTPGAFTDWSGRLFVDFGGFNIPVWNNGDDNPGLDPDEEGTIFVGDELEAIQDNWGITPSGVFLLYGWIDANEGGCDMDAYIELPPDGLFSGVILLTLWIILVILVVILIILFFVVQAAKKRALAAVGGAAAASAGSAGGGVAASAVADADEEIREEVADMVEEGGPVAPPEETKPKPKGKGGAGKGKGGSKS